MGVISEACAAAVGLSASHPAWEAIRAELVEYAQRVFAGLETPTGALSRGLGLTELRVAELRAGRDGGLSVDELLAMFERLELPIELKREGDRPVVTLIGPPLSLG
ncbi:MAG: hypothetical protein MUC96_36150 [Myxococcaceae bacterium]|nr:hypothetical protein [Myxococcaceae bacterium]